MDRRLALTSLAAIMLLPSLAYAQSGNAEAPDVDHIKKTLTVGSASLATSRIALQKAHHALVKQFAQFEVAEQETIADILKSMQEPSTTSATVKAPTDDEVRANLDAKGQQLVQKLQSGSGASFDKAYVMGQIEGHHELLTIQEAFLKKGGLREEENVSKLARGQIKEHLALLSIIEKELGRKG